MKAVILEMFRPDEALMTLIPEDNWYERSAITSIPTENRFAVLAGAGTLPGIGGYRVQSYEIWVHDRPGTYDNINTAIERMVELLDGKSSESAFGSVMSFEYVGESADLEDPDFRTVTRSLSLRVVGRRR